MENKHQPNLSPSVQAAGTKHPHRPLAAEMTVAELPKVGQEAAGGLTGGEEPPEEGAHSQGVGEQNWEVEYQETPLVGGYPFFTKTRLSFLKNVNEKYTSLILLITTIYN